MGIMGIALGLIGCVGGIFVLVFSQLFAELFNIKTSTIVIVSIVMIVLGIFFGVTAEPSSGNSSGGCRNCGRKTDLVAGYGYCYSCYEAFVDWQEDYYD